MRTRQPKDALGEVIQRAMGAPIVVDDVVLNNATTYADLIDLSGAAYADRVFTGISVENPDDDKTLHISFDDDDHVSNNTKHMVVSPGQVMVIDNLMFGPGVPSEDSGRRTTKIRGKLSSTEGTAYTATITYSGNATDGQTFTLNGLTYEFSDDGSLADPSSGNVKVDIKASDDLTWTEVVAVINANDPEVIASINTGTDVVTITSVAGGTAADAIALADVDTGATFSAATLGGGSSGVTPIVHIW